MQGVVHYIRGQQAARELDGKLLPELLAAYAEWERCSFDDEYARGYLHMLNDLIRAARGGEK